MMQSSKKPDISAPLSRAKKHRDGTALAVLTMAVAAFYLAVFLVISLSVDSNGSGTSVSSKVEATMVAGQFLVLSTKHGEIRIRLRPDLSPESVRFVGELVRHCDKCQFYRAENKLLLQGVMKNQDLVPAFAKGICPPEFATRPQQDCPPHDPDCDCHGPTMTTGMVGWAGGGIGPDFFINVHDTPVDWWGQQHTVWGMVEDVPSLHLVRDQILGTLPVKKQGLMMMLEEPFDFQMKLE